MTTQPDLSYLDSEVAQSLLDSTNRSIESWLKRKAARLLKEQGHGLEAGGANFFFLEFIKTILLRAVPLDNLCGEQRLIWDFSPIQLAHQHLGLQFEYANAFE